MSIACSGLLPELPRDLAVAVSAKLRRGVDRQISLLWRHGADREEQNRDQGDRFSEAGSTASESGLSWQEKEHCLCCAWVAEQIGMRAKPTGP